MRSNPHIVRQSGGQVANIAAACILAVLIGSAAAAQQEPTGKAAPSRSTSRTEASTGVRTQTATDPRHLDFYDVQDNDLRASDLIGMAVYNLENKKVGLINDAILADGKLVKAVVISVGGFLGAGHHDVAVAADSLVVQKQDGHFERAIVNATEASLRNAAPFQFRSKLNPPNGSPGNSPSAGSAAPSAATAPLVRPSSGGSTRQSTDLQATESSK